MTPCSWGSCCYFFWDQYWHFLGTEVCKIHIPKPTTCLHSVLYYTSFTMRTNGDFFCPMLHSTTWLIMDRLAFQHRQTFSKGGHNWRGCLLCTTCSLSILIPPDVHATTWDCKTLVVCQCHIYVKAFLHCLAKLIKVTYIWVAQQMVVHSIKAQRCS